MNEKKEEVSSTPENTAPKGRFCTCKYEQVRKGVKVFIRDDGSFTTNRNEAAPRAKFPVGKLVNLAGKITLKLNQKAEAALAA